MNEGTAIIHHNELTSKHYSKFEPTQAKVVNEFFPLECWRACDNNDPPQLTTCQQCIFKEPVYGFPASSFLRKPP